MKPRLWVCPKCGEEHQLPKSGPFSECCLMASLSDVAFQADAKRVMDEVEASPEDEGA